MIGDEQTLVIRARRGDDAAFEALMKTALPKVLGLSRKMLRNDEDAWDVAQEAFLRAWKGIGNFRGEAAFSTWVAGIACRGALDRIRMRKKVVEITEFVQGKSADVVENRSLGDAISKAVGALSEPERAVFSLHEFGEMKYKEVAGELHIPIGTVMSRLHAARMRLREELKTWWKETVT